MADENPDSFTNFIQVNGTWVLTFTGLISACVGTTFVYSYYYYPLLFVFSL